MGMSECICDKCETDEKDCPNNYNRHLVDSLQQQLTTAQGEIVKLHQQCGTQQMKLRTLRLMHEQDWEAISRFRTALENTTGVIEELGVMAGEYGTEQYVKQEIDKINYILSTPPSRVLSELVEAVGEFVEFEKVCEEMDGVEFIEQLDVYIEKVIAAYNKVIRGG